MARRSRESLFENTSHQVLVVDKLTYAGNLDSLAPVAADNRYRFELGDICNGEHVRKILGDYEPDIVLHLAAETHVDRSIDGPAEFIQTNVVGTLTLLEAALSYWRNLPHARRKSFRFHHVSTDEVFGSLGNEGLFHEDYPYQPNSPYSASKAGSDHLVRAWHHTYGLPTLITNCSNNYGPYHFPEKLIPLVILNALEGKPLPVYGKGENVRDWLYVDDHADALCWSRLKARSARAIISAAGTNAVTSTSFGRSVAWWMSLRPIATIGPRETLITFVADRPGHDLRYAIDARKIETGPRVDGQRRPSRSGLRKTVAWYLENRAWWERVRSGVYRGERLGIAV